MNSFDDAEVRPKARLRFEVLFASLWLALGLFVLPALVYAVGVKLLGPYLEGERGGLGPFYTTFFGDLAAASVQAWALALGPLVLAYLVRAVFIGVRGDEPPRRETRFDDEPRKSANTRRESARVEPRVSLD